MARLVNGILTVDSFNPEMDEGSFSIENAIFQDVSDTSGNGAYVVEPGFLVYVPALDAFTFLPLPGVFHRYKFASVTVTGFDTVSGVLVWDEPGPVADFPIPGVCMVSQPSPSRFYSMPALEQIYPTLPAGITSAALALDTVHITDAITSGGGGGGGAVTYLHTQSSAATTWTISHNKNASFTVTVFNSSGEVITPDSIVAQTSNIAVLTFSVPLSGKAVFVFV